MDSYKQNQGWNHVPKTDNLAHLVDFTSLVQKGNDLVVCG